MVFSFWLCPAGTQSLQILAQLPLLLLPPSPPSLFFISVPRLPYLLPCFLPDWVSSLFDAFFLRFVTSVIVSSSAAAEDALNPVFYCLSHVQGGQYWNEEDEGGSQSHDRAEPSSFSSGWTLCMPGHCRDLSPRSGGVSALLCGGSGAVGKGGVVDQSLSLFHTSGAFKDQSSQSMKAVQNESTCLRRACGASEPTAVWIQFSGSPLPPFLLALGLRSSVFRLFAYAFSCVLWTCRNPASCIITCRRVALASCSS